MLDLPEGIKPTSEYPVIITVTDQHGQPQMGVTVITLGDADYIEKGVTDMFGKITLQTAQDGFTDDTGKVRIDGMYVFVNDENGAIENAFVKLNDDNTISVTLPDGTNIGYANRITVTVTDKNGNPLKDISVTVSDTVENSLTDKTDENGKIIVPPLSEDITDSEGKAKVNGYNVLITDETKPIENAFVTIGEGQINVMLPEGTLIDIDNRITATITDSEDKPVKDMTVIFTDKAERTESNVTDENGRASVPPTNIDVTDFNGYGEVDGYIVIVKNAVGAIEKAHIRHNAEVKNEDGTVKSAKNISVELSENIKFDYANRIIITVSNKADNTAVKDMSVIVSEKAIEGTETKSLTGITDKDGVIILPPSNEGVTDKNGMLILPASEHKAYIFGYNDGTFRPDNNMSRAEAAANFARLISKKKGEKISGKSSFNDVSKSEWYSDYIGYLSKYGIIKGYADNTFRPNDNVSRAEFVAMTVRFNSLFNEVKKGSYTVKYTDVATNYWAYSDVAYAKHAGWLNGYADGTFKGDNTITRAEVVTVVNKATGRTADESYIKKNVSVLNKFTDIRNNSIWYYADVMESANTHLANSANNTETWVK